MTDSDLKYINEFLYKNNVRNMDTINFKPDIFNNFTHYNRVKNIESDTNTSFRTSGTTSTKGSKQNPELREILIEGENIKNRFHWDCLDKNPDGSCKPGDSYQKIDEYLTSNLGAEILPVTNPVTTQQIFGEEHNSCPTRDSYHKSITLNLPPREEGKPKYGTVRAFDVVGPRTLSDKYINLNHTTPFDIKNSGYNIQNSENFITNLNHVYENFTEHKTPKKLPSYDLTNEQEEDEEETEYCKTQNLNCKSTVDTFSNHNSIYDGDCGTKNLKGGILEKNVQKPNLSKSVLHNIIGLNKENINESMINIRNKALFNIDIKDESNLNNIKKISHENFIQNTNQLRIEFNNKFETHTQKLQRNLSHR